ncbi:MAG: hypothetical protein AAGC74_07515 [Verrucomicrobiota bacterium]
MQWKLVGILVFGGLLSGCFEDEEANRRVKELELEVEDLYESLDKRRGELRQYEAVAEENLRLLQELEGAKEKVEQSEQLEEERLRLEEMLRELRKEFDAYQEKYEAQVREKAVGEEYELVEVGGRGLRGVLITSVSESEVKVRHSNGFATLKADVAPKSWKERFFLKTREESEAVHAARESWLASLSSPYARDEEEGGSVQRAPSAHQKAKNARREQEKFLASAGKELKRGLVIIETEGELGCGFFARDGITTYLYTAAEVFDRGDSLKIRGFDGKEWSRFGKLETIRGLNLARLEVFESVENALDLQPGGGGEAEVQGSGLVLGITLEGDFFERKIVFRSAHETRFPISNAFLPPVLGGVLVNASGRVVAVVSRSHSGQRDLWKEEEGIGKVRSIALRLNRTLNWEESTLGLFLSARQRLKSFDARTRFIRALSEIQFHQDGLNIERRVAGDYTVQQILVMNQSIPLAVDLLNFHYELTSSNARMSRRDLSRRFLGRFETVARKMNEDLPRKADYPAFFQEDVEHSLEWREKARVGFLRAVQRLK